MYAKASVIPPPPLPPRLVARDSIMLEEVRHQLAPTAQIESQPKPIGMKWHTPNPCHSQSKPGIKMVDPEPCKEIRRRLQLFMVGIVPY